MTKEQIKTLDPLVQEQYELYERMASGQNVKMPAYSKSPYSGLYVICLVAAFITLNTVSKYIMPLDNIDRMMLLLPVTLLYIPIMKFVVKRAVKKKGKAPKEIQKIIDSLTEEEWANNTSDKCVATLHELLECNMKNIRDKNKMKNRELDMMLRWLLAPSHNNRGEFTETLKIMSVFDPKKFIVEPYAAHIYYAFVIEALFGSGDVANAVKAYEDGLYYLETYRNDPHWYAVIRVALARYEFHKGEYERSIEILRSILSYRHEGGKSLGETGVTKVLYRIAQSYAELGQIDEAKQTLDEITKNNMRCTPYYAKCIEELSQKIS